MALRLPEHAHCEKCGDPIPFRETHCSEECKTSAENERMKEKRSEYLLYASVGVMIVAVAIISFVLF